MTEQQASADPDRPDNPYRRMPERIAPEDMIAGQPASPPADPEGGRNPDERTTIWAGG